MKRRVLIVSPHFPPINAADHQRVRMSLPYLEEFGWEATILAVRAQRVEGMPLDSLLAQTVPINVDVTRVSALPAPMTRLVGMGSLALRSLPYLWRAGNALLKRRKFDLVFFSTTQFPVMILGRVWKRRFGVPYIVDFQDPWLDDYYERTGTPPPGGRWRHRFSRFLASKLEPRVMSEVSQVLAVSPSYIETLNKRYPALRTDQFTALTFGAPERDFQFLEGLGLQEQAFDASDDRQNWVYVGVAGKIMEPALRILFSALRDLYCAAPSTWGTVRLVFIGTSYAPKGQGCLSVKPLANQYGVGDLVEEQTDRVGYFEGLRSLKGADALLVIGSDNPSYTPSKLYPYILVRRPLLAILHGRSAATEFLRRTRAGLVVTFGDREDPGPVADAVDALTALHRQANERAAPRVNWQEFAPYTAREMTRKLCAVFDLTARPSRETAARTESQHVGSPS